MKSSLSDTGGGTEVTGTNYSMLKLVDLVKATFLIGTDWDS